MAKLQLTPRQHAQLEQQLRGTRDAGLFRRTWAVLEAARGRPLAEVARLLRMSRVSVHHWINCFAHTQDPTCLRDHRGGSHPTAWNEGLQALLCAALGQQPERFGYQATTWTVPLLREHLARWGGVWLSEDTIRRRLDEVDYVWKRPRQVLDPDPERGKKTPHPLAVGAAAARLRPAVRG
jgi:transposase